MLVFRHLLIFRSPGRGDCECCCWEGGGGGPLGRIGGWCGVLEGPESSSGESVEGPLVPSRDFTGWSPTSR